MATAPIKFRLTDGRPCSVLLALVLAPTQPPIFDSSWYRWSWPPTDVFSIVFDFAWVRDPEDDVLELLGRENDVVAVVV